MEFPWSVEATEVQILDRNEANNVHYGAATAFQAQPGFQANRRRRNLNYMKAVYLCLDPS